MPTPWPQYIAMLEAGLVPVDDVTLRTSTDDHSTRRCVFGDFFLLTALCQIYGA